MAMTEYFTFTKAPKLEPHDQLQFISGHVFLAGEVIGEEGASNASKGEQFMH